MKEENRLLTVKEICEIKKIDRSTLWRWRKDGCPYENRGRRSPRFDLQKVEEWEKSRGGNECLSNG